MPRQTLRSPNHPEESNFNTSALLFSNQSAPVNATQIDGLIRLINVTRAVSIMDVLEKKGGKSDSGDILKSIAACIEDHRFHSVVNPQSRLTVPLTGVEACGLVAEIVVRRRLHNPSQETDAKKRIDLNAKQEAVIAAINDFAITRPGEFANALEKARSGLPPSRIGFKSSEFIGLTGSDYVALASGPATTCTCVAQKQQQLLREANIQPCGKCPDCRGGRLDVCFAREQKSFLKRQSITRCQQCSSAYGQLNQTQGTLLTGLSDVLLPFVMAITGFLFKRGGSRSVGLNHSSVNQNLAIHVAHSFFHGKCYCHLDAERMKRGNESERSDYDCGSEHALAGWNPTEMSLLQFLFQAATNCGYTSEKLSAFVMPIVPSAQQALIYTEAKKIQRGLPGGMVIRQVGPHLASEKQVEPTRYQVYNVLHCQQCGETVSFQNQCKCTRDRTALWPSATESTEPILDAEGARTNVHPDTLEPIKAYRVIPGSSPDDCVHSPDGQASLAKRKAPFLFPVAGKSCPCCGRQMPGLSVSIVDLPVTEFIDAGRIRSSGGKSAIGDDDELPDMEAFEWHLGSQEPNEADGTENTDSDTISQEVEAERPSTKTVSFKSDVDVDMIKLVPGLIAEIREKWGRRNKKLNQFTENLLSNWQNQSVKPFTFKDFSQLYDGLVKDGFSKDAQKKMLQCIALILNPE